VSVCAILIPNHVAVDNKSRRMSKVKKSEKRITPQETHLLATVTVLRYGGRQVTEGATVEGGTTVSGQMRLFKTDVSQ
jgi:hypothetical protein